MKITSSNNEKVLFWSKLKMKKYRDAENLFIVESPHLVEEALKKGIVKEIITSLDLSYDVPTYEVTIDIMKKLTMMVTPPNVMAVCNFIVPEAISGNVLVLDRIQDPGNLGTLIRSAVAFDFKTLILSNDTVDVYNDKVIRSSEGMLFNINIVKDDLECIIPKLKQMDYKVIGTDVRSGKHIKSFVCDKCAYVIGNEGQGMSEAVSNLCDDNIKLNMKDNCESLNAAVAGSIIMYEVYNG